VFFYKFAKTEYSRSLTLEVLGQAFGIEPSHVSRTRRIRHIHFKFWTYSYSGLPSDPKKYQIRDDTLPVHIDHILRLFRTDKAAMASTTIRAAWRQTGFEYENRNMTTYLSINKR
jgi:hypothetical protein